ncbi:MAG TPA: sugar phosphate isomerase/epimerase [Candidatus Synoicihabitans sp.]|nr:sugar phosphate isomerase/epimerase [Candidatus Synoicihabitans sp.]
MTTPSRLILAFLCIVGVALAKPAPVTRPMSEQLGLQLWSLRGAFIKNPSEALDLAKSYGITEVETAGTARMSPEQFRVELDQRGLKAVSSHMSYERLQNDLDGALAEAQALGAKWVIIPILPNRDSFDHERAMETAANFNRWGKAFRAAGIGFGYHPHGFEFGPGKTAGKTLFEEMVEATNADDVHYEMDVFWVVHGGADPVRLLRQYAGRWVALHIKDMRKGVKTGSNVGSAPAEDNVAVGAGQIDWPSVLRTAREVGVQYFFIEDETVDATANIPASLQYLRGLKL